MLHAVIQGPRFLPSCASVIFCVLRVCPCTLYLPRVAADREGEGVECHMSSHGLDLQVADTASAPFALARLSPGRTFPWPDLPLATVSPRRLNHMFLPWAQEENVLSLPQGDCLVTSVLLWWALGSGSELISKSGNGPPW